MPAVPHDPLKFRDGRRYSDRLQDAKATTELDDAMLVAEGTLEGQTIVAAAQDFRFMAGSLGMAAGEAVIAGMLRAVEKKTPFILFAASGGARMQEGILSLMQMPRTTIAVQRLRDAHLPYIVVLTDPTTGGVTASYAMLGDIHIAEPGALICFAGPRVIQQTIREQLPEGFQRAEYLLAHGMIDMVVHRHKMRETLSRDLPAHDGERCRREDSRPQQEQAANGKHYLNGKAVDGKPIETLRGCRRRSDRAGNSRPRGALRHARLETAKGRARTSRRPPGAHNQRMEHPEPGAALAISAVRS